MKYTVHFINFGYASPIVFDSVEAALEYGKRCGFESSVIDEAGTVVASWSPINGTRRY